MRRQKIFDILAVTRLMNQIIEPAIKLKTLFLNASNENWSQVAKHRMYIPSDNIH